ncbi:MULTISPECIES: hypothetical protein [unclassified Spirillospora]|uniref:hypothetical protein n=1 Tax=unclassified Spirillospora TaxID=2642701 RepID=UPI00371D4878
MTVALWVFGPATLFLVLSLYVALIGRRMGGTDLHGTRAASVGAPNRLGMLVNVFTPGQPPSGGPGA